jgi:hypothetical protein
MNSFIELGTCNRFERGPDLAWCAFMCGALDLALSLRGVARKSAAGIALDDPTDPDDAVVNVLEELIRLGDELLEPMELADDTILKFDHILRPPLAISVRANSWLGLVARAQTLAEQVAKTVAGIADELEEILTDLERYRTDAPREEFVAKGLSRSISHLRLLLSFVEQPGEIAKA